METLWIIIGSLLGLAFLALPLIRGGAIGSKGDIFALEESLKKKESDPIKDRIDSIKLSLKDMDLEHKIGKIESEDFETLKNELLEEWQSNEKLYQEALKKEEGK